MPFRVGPWELIAVLAIVLIIFGVGKLPQVGRAVGDGIREFRRAQQTEELPAQPEAVAKEEKSS